MNTSTNSRFKTAYSQLRRGITLGEIGEKTFINEFLRPLFNPDNERNSIGDDCAAIEVPNGSFAIMSTDRVPADLIAFQADILNFRGLGRYLGVLNLSDVAACGGVPLALLFNCGTPPSLRVEDILELSVGLRDIAARFGAKIVGGDVTSSSEPSFSVTILGHVEKGKMLRRSGAKVGDSVFISREIGLTPVALDYCLNQPLYAWLSENERSRLQFQFLSIEPEIELGRRLCLSGHCSSCMDNTDGLAQSLSELARESNCSIVVQEDALQICPLVGRASFERNIEPITLALGPGADFGLVGTLDGNWTTEGARLRFGRGMSVIGIVEDGEGVLLEHATGRKPLGVRGWDCFRSQ